MTTLFTYADGTVCNLQHIQGRLNVIKSISGKHATDLIGFDPYQAALLIPELERFIAQRSSNKVGDLTWRVTDGSLCINDIPVLDLGPGRETARTGAWEVVSKMLTRGQSVDLFVNRPRYTTDLHMELWILERIETLSDEVDF